MYINLRLVKKIVFFVVILLNIPLIALSWSPSEDTLLAKKSHPRIFIVPDDYRALHPDAPGITISEIRSKIKSNDEYKKKIQSFVTMVDKYFDTEVVTDQGALNSSYNSINLSFIYILDPQVLSSASYGITFKHTKAEYGYRAIEYALHMATQQKKMTSVIGYPSWADYRTFDYSGNQGYGCINIALAIVNDWVHDKLTKDERQFILDGIINAHKYRYPSNEVELFAEGKHYGVIYNGAIGALGFYGDEIDGSGTYYADKINEFLNTFESWWIKSYAELHNKVFTGGSYSFQGTLYNRISVKNLIPGLLAMSTVLNKNYINDVGYTKFLPLHRVYSVNPLPQGDIYYEIGVHDVGPKNMDIRKEYGKYKIEFNSITYALDQANEKKLAGLHKWYEEKSGFLTGNEGNERYGMLIYDLLFGDEHVLPKSPSDIALPMSKNIGNGKYFMRSGFTSKEDTLITFNARKWHTNDYGHAHRNFSAFEIYKYGDLTTRRTVAKDFIGSGNKATTINNMWYNTICVNDGKTDSKGYNVMGFRGGYDNYEIDPEASSWSINGANHVGNIVGEDINSDAQNPQHYDYIDYDYSNAWDDTKVDYAEREFVYLRSKGGSNDEYVIVFDRINSVNPAFTKYWLLQCPFSPKLLDNSSQEIAMTAENYPNDPDTSGGRWVHQSSSDLQNNIIQLINTYSDNNSHGVLYNKTLLPDSFQINKTGGPGHYWEDANGKTVAVADGDGSLTEREKNYHGTYTMQIQSTTGKNYDNFLNVIQFGDSATLNQMTQVKKIQCDSNNMIGSLILDKVKNHVVLFNPAKSTEISKVSSAVSYKISTTAPSSHLLFNVLPDTQYQIKRGEVSFTAASNDIGVLSFEDSATGTGIVYSIDITDTVSKEISPPDDETADSETPSDETEVDEDDSTPPTPPELMTAVLNNNNEVELTWKENSESDLAEYYVHYGLATRTYKPLVPVGNVTSYTLGDLEEGNNYFFAVTAVDSDGNDSAPGNELEVSIPNVAPVISITSPTATGFYTTKASSLNISGSASDAGSVKNVTWSKSSGESGTADGTTNWVIPDLSFKAGDNVITVRAADDAGNEGSAELTVTYTETEPSSPSDLISNLEIATGSTYNITEGLVVGSKCYTDRSYKFTNLPDFLIGTTYIMTAKGDRYKTGSPFISFDINTNATVYVAHGDAITSKPSWLNSFEDTGQDLETNVQMSLYAKEFAAGTVELGKNGAGESMYSVIVIPKTDDNAGTDTDDESSASDSASSSDPLSVSDLAVYTGKTYELSSNLAVGNRCYIDRSYKYTEVPEFLLGSTYIMTAKGDRYKTGSPFISFDVNKDVTIYIVHYDNITDKPTWMQSFNDTGKDIQTNVKMSVFSKDFSTGRIELGENGAGEAMYTIIIVEK